MKSIWRFLIAVAVVVVLLVILLVIPHYRAKAAVRAYFEQLKAKGEKVSIVELTPQLSAEETSAGRGLLAAAGLLGNLTNYSSTMRWLSPGHALVGWAETNAIDEDATNNWPGIGEAVRKNRDRLATVKEELEKPAFGISLNFQGGFSILLPHLSQLKRTSLWFREAAALDLHEHDTTNAANEVTAGIEIVSKYRTEPLLISHLVRIAMMHLSVATTWEALQHPGWSEEQLAEWQRSWESVDLWGQLDTTYAMERAIGAVELPRFRNSYSNFMDAVNPTFAGNGSSRFDNFGEILAEPVEGMKSHLRYRAWKFWGSYEEEVYMGQIRQAAIEAVREMCTNGAFFPAYDEYNLAVTNIQKSHPGWENRFLFANQEEAGGGRFLIKAADAETARRMVVTAIALERHRRKRGNYPMQLRELAPEFLAKAPIDFMDGKPLRYRRNESGTFLLYSVGEDGKDDGGDGTSTQEDSVRSKQWFKGRDAVWPLPATAEEVAKYEADALSKVKLKPPGRRLVPPMTIPEPAATNATTN